MKKILFALVLAAVLNTPSAYASLDLGANLGIGGIGTYDGSTAFTYAFNADFDVSPNLAVGVYVSHAHLGDDLDGESMTFLAAEANYYFDHAFTGLYVGAKIGVDFESLTLSPAAVQPDNGIYSATSFAIGPAIGYLYPVPALGGLAVGGEANLFFMSTNTQTNTSILATARYAF